MGIQLIDIVARGLSGTSRSNDEVHLRKIAVAQVELVTEFLPPLDLDAIEVRCRHAICTMNAVPMILKYTVPIGIERMTPKNE